ncbi:MAG TPA: tetratricopeptide repeat protein [Oscillatoriaceae cyanobacterium]
MTEKQKMATWQESQPTGAGSREVLAKDIEAAQAGDPQSQYQLGFKYYLGATGAQDFNEAARWYAAAAEQGHAEAQYKLAKMKSQGIGLDVEHEAALKWFLAAGEQGHAEALFSIGELYAQGHGVEADAREAYRWLYLAWRRFDADLAAYLLGEGLDASVRGAALAAALGDAELAADLEIGLEKAQSALDQQRAALDAASVPGIEDEAQGWLTARSL